MQLGSWPAHVPASELELPSRSCTTGCHILHGAGGEGKGALAMLQAELARKGGSCVAAFEAVRARRPHYRGAVSAALLARVRDRCCGGANRSTSATARRWTWW